MTARDQQDAAEEEREDVGDDDLEVNTQVPDQPPDASDESAFLDLNESAAELGFVLQNHDEDDEPDDDEEAWSPFGTAAPPDAPPAYRGPSWRGERDGSGAERRRPACRTRRASVMVFGIWMTRRLRAGRHGGFLLNGF